MPAENLGTQDCCVGMVISSVDKGLEAIGIGCRVIVQQPHPFDVFSSCRRETRCGQMCETFADRGAEARILVQTQSALRTEGLQEQVCAVVG